MNPLQAAKEHSYLGSGSATSVRGLIKHELLRPNRALRHVLIPWPSSIDLSIGEDYDEQHSDAR
jgi:hypothetical protein